MREKLFANHRGEILFPAKIYFTQWGVDVLEGSLDK